MSKKEEIVSGGEPDEQSTDSVFDFLYHDVRRIGSFLAQFDYFGHLQQITASESASKGIKRGYHVKIGGSVPVPGALEGAEGSLTFGRDPDQTGSEALARVYDPLWTNALTLLDYLNERDLVVRDLSKARIGQFVLVSGKLTMSDLRVIRELLADSVLRKPLLAAVLKTPENEALASTGLKTPQERLNLVLAIIRILPHSLQFALSSASGAAWGSLDEGCITGAASDLTLKHGDDIPGDWNVLGILDGMQDAEVRTDKVSDIISGLIGEKSGNLGFAGSKMANLARRILGRPANTYALTPLLIFREVTG